MVKKKTRYQKLQEQTSVYELIKYFDELAEENSEIVDYIIDRYQSDKMKDYQKEQRILTKIQEGK